MCDASDNLTSYMGATFTWGRGRLLTKYAKYSTTINFVYDANGIRSGKVKTGIDALLRTQYLYDNEGRLRVEIIGTDNKYYLYSADGIIGFVQDGQRYLYRKNLFGDITAIYQGETKLAEYEYDAWGNCTITLDTNSVGKNNPFRYRGYYWDNDIKLYYLMSRYYDPKTGRFINADTFDYLKPKAINGLNLYAYCKNNPIMHIDPSGHEAWSEDTISDLISAAMILILGIIGIAAGSSFVANNSSKEFVLDIHFDGDNPEPIREYIPTLDKNGLKIINIILCGWKGYMYLDKNEEHFLYISLGNLSAVLGGFFDDTSKTNFVAGAKFSANLIEVGYDGPYLDLFLPLVGVGAGIVFNNWAPKFAWDPPASPGIEWSLNPVAIASDLVDFLFSQ